MPSPRTRAPRIVRCELTLLFFAQCNQGKLMPVNHLPRPSSLDNVDNDHYNCEHEQNMDEPAHRVTAHQPECPQNQQNNSDSPQHLVLLLDCSGPLPKPISARQSMRTGTQLLDGHPVLYALHTLYIFDEFGRQVFFGCIPGLAAQRDYAMFCLDCGV